MLAHQPLPPPPDSGAQWTYLVGSLSQVYDISNLKLIFLSLNNTPSMRITGIIIFDR